MRWQNAQHLSESVESCFIQIQQQRMQDIPIINSNIHVQAIDFQLFQNDWLGVLITPWFMNLIYMNPQVNYIGEKITHRFPFGELSFIASHELELGYYQSCSLYSPMFLFEQQSVAVQTARSALQTLLALPESHTLSRRALLLGQFQGKPRA